MTLNRLLTISGISIATIAIAMVSTGSEKAYHPNPPAKVSEIGNYSNYIIIDEMEIARESAGASGTDTINKDYYKIITTDTAQYLRVHYLRNDTTFHLLLNIGDIDTQLDNVIN